MFRWLFVNVGFVGLSLLGGWYIGCGVCFVGCCWCLRFLLFDWLLRLLSLLPLLGCCFSCVRLFSFVVWRLCVGWLAFSYGW